MLTHKEARQLVEHELKGERYPDELMIYDKHTIEFDYGWVFFYDFVNPKEHLTGNAPFLVNKFTKVIIRIATCYSPDLFTDEYEEKIAGVKNKWSIRLKNKIGVSKYIKFYKLQKRTIRFTKDIWKILNSHPNQIMEGNLDKILRLKHELEDVGIDVIIEKNGKLNLRLSERWDIKKLIN